MLLPALGEPPDPALDPGLRAAVAEHAAAWVGAVASAGLALFPAAEEDPVVALTQMLAAHAGPVLLVAPDVPRLDRALADAALGDLAAGCVLSLAPATDAKPFLLAFADPRPEALALLRTADRRRETIFAEAMALGDEVGLLRSERRVVTPADARALAIDPLVSPELRALAGRHL